MIDTILLSLGLSLLLTILTETALAFVFGVRNKHDLLLVLAVNMLTNPPLVLTLCLLTVYASGPPLWLILILELIVWTMEGFIYQKGLSFRRIHPLLFSILLNAASYLIGVFLS